MRVSVLDTHNDRARILTPKTKRLQICGDSAHNTTKVSTKLCLYLIKNFPAIIRKHTHTHTHTSLSSLYMLIMYHVLLMITINCVCVCVWIDENDYMNYH